MNNKNVNKNTMMGGLIYLIIFAIFNLLVFIIFKNRNGVFWLSYGFMTVSILVQIFCSFTSLKSRDVEATFFGIPLFSLSLYYFFAAMFVGLVFMIFQSAPMALALVLQILVLAIFAIVMILSVMGRDTVQAQNDVIKENVTSMRVQYVKVEALMNSAEDPALKSALKNLWETVRYSDPMTNDAVADLDMEIKGAMNELRILCEDDAAEAVKCCKRIERLFMERNSLLKATK